MGKKKVSIIGLMVLVLIIGMYIGNRVDFHSFLKKDLDKGRLLAVHIQDDAGNYSLSSSSNFPKDGYVLNLEKSICKNGGKLSQNPDTKAINLSTANIDECNLYFDIYKEDKAKETLDSLNVSSRGNFNEFRLPAPLPTYIDPDVSSKTASGYSAPSDKYMTYASSYTFDAETGTYTLNNPTVCKYSSCYSKLKNNYIVDLYGSTSTSGENYSNLDYIYFVDSSTTSTSLKYKMMKPEISDNYDYSKDGIYSMEDDYGTSYYYRGAVENNYVYFAGFYWRIIRVNGDGSLRIIYDGTQAYANGVDNKDRFAILNQGYSDGRLGNDLKYLGWMYGPADGTSLVASTSKEQAQSNEISLNIKSVLDDWYKNNIEDKGYGEYVSDTIFCNDRSTPGKLVSGQSYDTGLGYGKNYTAYGGNVRFIVNRDALQPTFKCSQKNDAFTVNDTEVGNGALTYPVGLITADEVMAAGSGKMGRDNVKYYLYKGSNVFTTMTPSNGGSSSTSSYGYNMFRVGINGTLAVASGGGEEHIPPVINLTSDFVKTMVGTGTMTDPYRAS